MTRGAPLDPARPVVFVGPSAPREAILAHLPDAEILPPAARGDVHRVRERGARAIVLVDGVFTHRLAVSPREIVDVLRDGALVVGASSMGALRAAECWPLGMRGAGLVYRLYRLGALDSDDEVAVALDPERAFAAVSVALVNVRFATSRARRAKILARAEAHAIVEAARSLFFADRRWPTILRLARVDSDRVRAALEAHDLKRDDAVAGARLTAALLANRDALARYDRRTDAPFRPPTRYTGPDPRFGLDDATAARALVEWLVGSGRYRRHAWAVVAGEPELSGLGALRPDHRAAVLRFRAAQALARLLRDPATFTQRLLGELASHEELEAEQMRWHAVDALAAAATREGAAPNEDRLAAARDEIAAAHGFRNWEGLLAEAADGVVAGAVPLAWVERAAHDLALARLWPDRGPRSSPDLQPVDGLSINRI